MHSQVWDQDEDIFTGRHSDEHAGSLCPQAVVSLCRRTLGTWLAAVDGAAHDRPRAPGSPQEASAKLPEAPGQPWETGGPWAQEYK